MIQCAIELAQSKQRAKAARKPNGITVQQT